VCKELGIECVSGDIADGFDACDPRPYESIGTFDFLWAHPAYWRMKRYTADERDLSNCPTLESFLNRLRVFILNGMEVLRPGGHFAILMGDYCDHEAGFVPLVYETKRLCFAAGLKQACTDIIRFSHGASSSTRVYKSSFIPGLHDVCMVFRKER
jgi:hypothetical protein